MFLLWLCGPNYLKWSQYGSNSWVWTYGWLSESPIKWLVMIKPSISLSDFRISSLNRVKDGSKNPKSSNRKLTFYSKTNSFTKRLPCMNSRYVIVMRFRSHANGQSYTATVQPVCTSSACFNHRSFTAIWQ